MKKQSRMMALMLCVGMVFPTFAACKNKTKTSADTKTINVQALKAGHGVDWLYEVAGKFEEAYASEGYKVNIIDPSSDMRGSVAIQEMARGYAEMNIDLYVSGGLTPGKIDEKGEYGVLAEEVDELFWNKPAIGYNKQEESGTIKNKIHEYIYEYFVSDNGKSYSMPYIQSCGGLVVNTKKLAMYGLELPKTTNELFDCWEKIYLGHNGVPNSTESNIYPFTYAPGTDNAYTLSWLDTLMAQYNLKDFQELESFENENGPMTENGYEVFNTQGYYEMMRVAYRAFDYKISAPGTTNQSLDQAQAQIMRGDGAVFMANGDWMLNEVKLNFKDYLKDIDFINYPVMSALGVRLFGAGTSYNQPDDVCESWLRYIIDCVDEGKTTDEIVALMASAKSATVAKADVETVRNARLTYNTASTQTTTMAITKGSDKKDIAALFCRMLASDDAAKTIAQFANSASAFSKTPITDSQYAFVNHASAYMNHPDAIPVTHRIKGLRKSMGVEARTPLKGHLQGAIATQTQNYYDGGKIVAGASITVYDTVAKAAQEAEYEFAKQNWSKWLANAE